jgi:hypothetical protein
MPNHVHLLLYLTNLNANLNTIMAEENKEIIIAKWKDYHGK